MMHGDFIGGFFAFEAQTARAATASGVLASWQGARPASLFGNARSALAALIAHSRPRKVWMPAFACHALVEAVPAEQLAWYAVGDTLTPDTAALARRVQPGDMLLGINYFGYGPDPDFLAFSTAHDDLVLVEDCAHSLAPDAPWGHWRLFSPRKLFGVADGGVLVQCRGDGAMPVATRPAATPWQSWQACMLRFEDHDGTRNAEWFAANQAHEAQMSVNDQGMTQLSRHLLANLDPAPWIARRRENHAVLAAQLARWQLPLPGRHSQAPFAFVLQLDPALRFSVLAQLHAEGIFAAVHWRNLPSPAADFAAEHRLAASLISLPCDHRYDADDMHRVACRVRELLE
ncbi:MAG: DegT/DnrJ/EryC1/StrS family aminotransferase [Rhodocyclaceae bacterium]